MNPMNTGPASEPSTAAVIRQRLVGLAVLLVAVFLLSVLLRSLGGPRTVDEEGLQTVVVPLGSSSELPVATAVLPEESTTVAAPAPMPSAPRPRPETTVAAAVDQPTATVEEPAAAPPPRASVAKIAPKPEPAAPPRSAKAPAAPVAARWYVVLGSFSDAANAKALVLRARRAGVPAESQPQRVSGGVRVRVRAGPFKGESEAQSARATLIVEGMTNARVVKEP